MKLSIIIPIFNEKNTLLKLLNLIEKETDISKQLILVDDQSTDNSLELIKKYNFKSDYKILSHDFNKVFAADFWLWL